MKIPFAALSAAAATLLPVAVVGIEEEIISPQCWIGNGWEGPATGLAETGSGAFSVISGGRVTCRLEGLKCNGDTAAYFAFNSAASSGFNAGSIEASGSCKGGSVNFTAPSSALSGMLHYDISVTGRYERVVFACYCDDDGTTWGENDVTLGLVGAAYDAANNFIDDFVGQETLFDVGSNLYNAFGCFSESAVADVRGKGVVAMKDLVPGDEVLTEGNAYEPMYTFGHRDPNSRLTEFVRIFVDGTKDPLELTGNHMVKLAAGGRHVRADRLRLGDRLLRAAAQEGDAGAAVVTEIETVTKRGLYMPLTPTGNIAVNGIVASNYISLDDKAPAVAEHSNQFFSFLGATTPDHLLSHWWLSPFRMLCMGVSSGFCGSDSDDNEGGILPWLVAGWKLAEAAESQPALVRVLFFGIPAFLVLGMFNAVEHVFLGPSVAPGLVVLMVAALVLARKMKKAVNDSDTGLAKA